MGFPLSMGEAESFINDYGYTEGSEGLTYWEIHASEIEEDHGDIGPAIVRRDANDDYTRDRVANVGDDELAVQAVEVCGQSLGEMLPRDASERVWVPQQGFGLGTPVVGEGRGGLVAEAGEDHCAVAAVLTLPP